MYARILRNADRTRRFSINLESSGGWEVRDEQDDRVTRRVHYTDWHRVERARRAFALEALTLRDAGWIDA